MTFRATIYGFVDSETVSSDHCRSASSEIVVTLAHSQLKPTNMTEISMGTIPLNTSNNFNTIALSPFNLLVAMFYFCEKLNSPVLFSYPYFP